MSYTAEDVWPDIIENLDTRVTEYTENHDYYMGEQDLAIDLTEFQTRFGTTFAEFRDNMARPVIESAESRVRVLEFPDEEATEAWGRLDMPSKSRQVHTEAMVKGDAYVLVLPDDDGNAVIWPQVSESCTVVYSQEDPREAAAGFKYWVDEIAEEGKAAAQPYLRFNLYFDDRIERYISTSSRETFSGDLNDYEPFDERVSKHDVGRVPMFEFNCSYDLTDARGRSDLTDAKGLVDAINKTFLDMLTASEYTAAPQRWATGIEIPLDPQTGKPIETYKAGDHKLWTAPAEMAKFGQFEAGDLKGYRDAVDLLVDHLGFTTRTPSYALMQTVQYPSGEALRSAEAPLRSRVGDHQTAFSPVWRDIMMAVLLLNGTTVDPDDWADYMPRWLPVNAPFSTTEMLEELKVHVETLGVPEEMAWRKAGYTEVEIEEMKAMREEQAAIGEEAVAAAGAAAVLNPVVPEAGLTQDNLLEPPVEEVPVGQTQ